MAENIYKGTPTIAVMDNRGLVVRSLAYNRQTVSDTLDERISRTVYSPLGYVESQCDPRLFTQQQNDSSVLPNVRNTNSLSGQVLHSQSVDSGWVANINDAEGRSAWFLDSRGSLITMEYDQIGRPVKVNESTQGGSQRISERFVYGENDANAKENNLRGKLVRHYDTAGCLSSESFAITGHVLTQTRKLLNNLDNVSDWQGDDENSWQNALASQAYTTNWTFSALGEQLSQNDAEGNLQRYLYDVAGQLAASFLTLNGQSEQTILSDIRYNANGQKLSETAGNGVVTDYEYEESTLRLIGIKTSRTVSGNNTILQDLRYEYDPVGNVVIVHNDAEATRFFKNRKVVPENRYQYDALYQLVSASGRESDANRNYQSFPSGITPIPSDANQYVNYTQSFTYDRGGNLTRIQHNGASQYTTNIAVSENSNRAVWQSGSDPITDIDSWFDARGNLNKLQQGIALSWDSRNQLTQVSPVVRDGDVNDSERYWYGGNSARIVKRTLQKTANSTQERNVIYLPGLELRSQATGGNVNESLSVIKVDSGGRPQVKVLHWSTGKPDGIDNDQFRYAFNDRQNSSLLELDASAQIISHEEYYAYGGTAIWATRSQIEANYKFVRYSGKELDATGLYYYGYRYYIPWIGRWLNPDPIGIADGLNVYQMVGNNPVTYKDRNGLVGEDIAGMPPLTPGTQWFFTSQEPWASATSPTIDMPFGDGPSTYRELLEQAVDIGTRIKSIMSFGARGGGFELTMQLRDDTYRQMGFNQGFNTVGSDTGAIYLDAESARLHPATRYTDHDEWEVSFMSNPFWDVIYKKGIFTAKKMTFLITREWLESSFTWEEFDWFVEAKTAGHDIEGQFIIFPNAQEIFNNNLSINIRNKTGKFKGKDLEQKLKGGTDSHFIDVTSMGEPVIGDYLGKSVTSSVRKTIWAKFGGNRAQTGWIREGVVDASYNYTLSSRNRRAITQFLAPSNRD